MQSAQPHEGRVLESIPCKIAAAMGMLKASRGPRIDAPRDMKIESVTLPMVASVSSATTQERTQNNEDLQS
jgi:hypothetical protein